MGIDVVGFVQMVFKIVNIVLFWEVFQQVYIGSIVDFVEQFMFGDVVFFEN